MPSASSTPAVTASMRACSGSPIPVIVVPPSPHDADVLKDAAFVAVGEVLRRRHPEIVDLDARRDMREADERLGVRVRQRFQQHAVDDGEDGGVGAKSRAPTSTRRPARTSGGVACRETRIGDRAPGSRARRRCSCGRSPRECAPCCPASGARLGAPRRAACLARCCRRSRCRDRTRAHRPDHDPTAHRRKKRRQPMAAL